MVPSPKTPWRNAVLHLDAEIVISPEILKILHAFNSWCVPNQGGWSCVLIDIDGDAAVCCSENVLFLLMPLAQLDETNQIRSDLVRVRF